MNPSPPTITLRAYLASRETLSDLDHNPDYPPVTPSFNTPKEVEHVIWDSAWRAKIKLARADALIAALNATEIKHVAYTSPLLALWHATSGDPDDGPPTEQPAQVAEDAALEALRHHHHQIQSHKDRQIEALSKQIEELTQQLANIDALRIEAEERGRRLNGMLIDSQTVEAKLRVYIDKLRKAGDDYGRDEDGKWWWKVRNEQH